MKEYVTMKKLIVFIFLFFVGFFGGIIFMYYFDSFTYYSDIRVIGHDDNGLLEYVDTIPDEKTALRIAKAVWLPIYGRKNLIGYSYKIILIENKTWAIRGVNRLYKYFNVLGGGPYIDLDKRTGQILIVGNTGANPKEAQK
jgi:hypothetical protein